MLRDTDGDWAGIAGEPFYGVFSHPEWFRDQITPERLAHFWATGEQEIDGLLGLVRQHFGEFRPRSAIDFGCGVGRLTRAIARHVESAYGVDVAEGMIEEAKRWALPNTQYGFALPNEDVDWINSIIVFQHIHPARGFPLLQALLDRLKPGGGITLQFAIYKERRALGLATGMMDYAAWDGERLLPMIETPYGSGAMMMYDYDLTRILALLHKAGIEDVYLRHTDHGGNHGVFVLGRKVG